MGVDRLDAMQAFVRLVELGSFTKAGAELQVKQSTVSKWISALEAQLEVQLIQRTTRRHRVTDAGQHFYQRAKQILATYEQTELELRAGDELELSGRLRVNLPVVFGGLFVVPALPEFLRAHPRLELELGFDDRYIDLLSEDVDVAVRVGTPRDSSLRARQLAITSRRVVAAPCYLERRGAPMHPRELGEHDCLRFRELGGRDVWVFEQGGRKLRARVGGRVAIDNSEALLTMAREGLGVALLASWLVREAVEAGELVTLLDDWSLPPAPIQALTPPTRHVHPRVRAFVDFLVELLAPLDER